jgi:hypothetical protein
VIGSGAAVEVQYPKEWSGLAYPQWRSDLILTLKELADPVYQREAWIERTRDTHLIVGIDEVFHTLFDQLDLDDPRGDIVGDFLFDNAEIQAVKPVATILLQIYEVLGDLGDEDYLAHPRWPELVAAAAQAHAELAKRGLPTFT